MSINVTIQVIRLFFNFFLNDSQIVSVVNYHKYQIGHDLYNTFHFYGEHLGNTIPNS